ncbi:hypothetical protein [Deefgea rivuli]|uniref:hypothetical protein n=1 Tax=Deefgea rivuli TaxID=400948 RepID=UPI0004816FCD|nr:hypothetical protein [Deefgea rivuli]
MARNFAGESNANRFLGLGQALLEHLKSSATNFKQSVSVQAEEQSAAVQQGEIALSIQTHSGARVALTLNNQGDSLGVALNIDGELSTDEQTAVSALAESFELTVRGLLTVPPRLNIAGITQVDSNQIKALDLKASFTDQASEVIKFDFHSDASQRQVKLATPQGKLSVNVDLQQTAILGNATQREKAVGRYLQQMEQANQRGKPDAAMQTLFQDAFTNLHRYYPGDAGALQGVRAANVESLKDYNQALLTGLGDFQADLAMSAASSNPMRPNERDHFNFQMAQSSRIVGRQSIQQKQDSSLSASYHESLQADLPLRLTMDKKSQNYNFVEIKDQASSQIDLAFDGKHQLISATLEKSAQQSTKISRYEMGKLVKESQIPAQYQVLQDLLSTLQSLEKQKIKHIDDETLRQQKLSELNNVIFLEGRPDELAKTNRIQALVDPEQRKV